MERIEAVDCSYFISSVLDFHDVIQVRSNSDEDWLSEDFFFKDGIGQPTQDLNSKTSSSWVGKNFNDPNLGLEKSSQVRPNYIVENSKVFLFKMRFRGRLWQKILGMTKPCRNVTGTATNSHNEREAIPPSEKRE